MVVEIGTSNSYNSKKSPKLGIVDHIKKIRRKEQLWREYNFRNRLNELFEQYIFKSEIQQIFERNIYFNREIKHIVDRLQKIIDEVEESFDGNYIIVSDLDGVVRMPFYRVIDWEERSGDYKKLMLIYRQASDLLLFSKRIEIPSGLYNVLYFALSLLYSGKMLGDVPLFLPDNVFKNRSDYGLDPSKIISLTFPEQHTLIRILNNGKLDSNIELPENYNYLNKGNAIEKVGCMEKIWLKLKNNQKVFVIGSSFIDRDFFYELICFLQNNCNNESGSDICSILNNLHYLDTNLTIF